MRAEDRTLLYHIERVVRTEYAKALTKAATNKDVAERVERLEKEVATLRKERE